MIPDPIQGYGFAQTTTSTTTTREQDRKDWVRSWLATLSQFQVPPSHPQGESVMDYVQDQRRDKDRFFKASPYSPLPPQLQQKFTGLLYFDPNPVLVFDLEPEEFAEKVNVKMLTSTGDTRYYLRWGKVRFRVEGQDAELTLFLSPGDSRFFVPFTDATSGKETYGAGRYIEVEQDSDGLIHLDLNNAYNPYCAYSEPPSIAAREGREPVAWSCPVPPAENRLKVPIRAGEKKPPLVEWFGPDAEDY
jgi:uncharacterized protein (DUF1684 family)